MTFGERLYAAMRERGQFCVGIDPHPALLAAWGLPDSAAGLESFARITVDAVASQLAVVKPQAAFFERHGSRGIAVLEHTIAGAREAGALVLLDVKRGDIGTTMQAYADAYLDPSSDLCADAVTVSPYLGFGSLRPALETAAKFGNGVFVLALTSNPDGAEVQGAQVRPDDRAPTVAGALLDSVRGENAGAEPLGSVGCVVGATVGEAAARRVNLNIGGPLLAPGFGEQGGTPEALRRVFGDAAHLVLPSSSRGILSAGPDKDALRAATSTAQKACRQVLAG